eukprot:gene44461-60223_t
MAQLRPPFVCALLENPWKNRCRLTPLGPGDVTFRALRRWRSPRTSALYPVEQAITVRLPEGERTLTLKPLFDDQELDSRAGGGPVYWEGAVSDGGAAFGTPRLHGRWSLLDARDRLLAAWTADDVDAGHQSDGSDAEGSV